MKKKIIDFLKKNILYEVIILLIIGFILYCVFSQRHIANLAADKAVIELKVSNLETQREELIKENDGLIKERDKYQKQKDSIKAVQEKQRAYFEYVIKKNKEKIDSLLNIPDDSVFVRLQPIFPNSAQEPLKYPFSGGQIRQIYSTAISYPMLKQEYGLQTSLLSTCNLLNKKYEQSELNYQQQVTNLNKQISNCDEQIGLKDSQLKITQKQLKAKTFWNWTQKGIIVAAIVKIFVFK